MKPLASMLVVVVLLLAGGLALVGCARDAHGQGGVDAGWVAQRAQACAACHGPRGVSNNPAFPTLAGQPASYLVHALTAYRDGQRNNAIMSVQAQSLTDAQIQALAIYYHQQSTPLSRTLDDR